MSILDFASLFGKKTQSGNVAKDRLKLVLIHDRMNCSTELLEMMRSDIIAVISKYVEIDNDDFNIEVSTLQGDGDGENPLIFAVSSCWIGHNCITRSIRSD